VAPREFFDVLPSTQSRARELARAGAPAGTGVVAATQSDGRGRLAHGWCSPRGGLYLSLVTADLLAAGPVSSLAFGVALHELFLTRWNVSTRLKWPNDLLSVVSGHPPRKLAGVLIDRVEGSSGARTVVGVGVNVSSSREDFPLELRDRIGVLAELVHPVPSLSEVEAGVWETILRVAKELPDPEKRARWLTLGRSCLYGRGSPARLDGAEVGRIQGLGDDGALWVDGPSGARSFLAGELVVEEEA
jgi:BirA family biotin operon repressor/biotin-[acetyl-CoA-carboxylase] ligase